MLTADGQPSSQPPTSVPSLSVVSCVKNGGPHLAQFEQALRAAWRDEYELVLLDDGSTDDTPQVFERWNAEFTRVVHIRNEQSGGLGAAQVKAVAAAHGDYVWLIDCDDQFPDHAPATLLAAAARSGADVVVGRGRSVDGTDGSAYLIDAHRAPASLDRHEALRQMLTSDIEGYTWTKLYRRSLFDDSSDLPTPSTQCDLCRTALAIANSAAVELIDDVVYTYIRHGASLMDRRDPPLQNLLISRNYLVGLVAANIPPSAVRRRLIALFSTWFLASSAVKIPIYVHAGDASIEAGYRIARAAMKTVRVVDVLRQDPGIGVQALLLRISPALYSRVFRARLGRQART